MPSKEDFLLRGVDVTYVCSAIDHSVLVACKDGGGEMVRVKFGDKIYFYTEVRRTTANTRTISNFELLILNFWLKLPPKLPLSVDNSLRSPPLQRLLPLEAPPVHRSPPFKAPLRKSTPP